MGIRIHKTLGYGITNYIGDKDARFNVGWKKELYNDDYRQKFLDFLKDKESKIINTSDKLDISFTKASIEEDEHWCPADWVQESPFEAEKDHRKRPLVFASQKKWTRYDNIIDYYESKRRRDGGIKDYVQSLKKEYIYPYARYVDVRTGKIPGEKDYVFEVLRMYNSEFWEKTNDDWVKEIIGLTKEEFELYVWPDVPRDIKLFAEFLNIFKNPLDIYCLRPMIYTHWS